MNPQYCRKLKSRSKERMIRKIFQATKSMTMWKEEGMTGDWEFQTAH
jgi:hypothetical protein